MKRTALILFLIVLLFSYIRLFVGIDLTDEALYVGNALLPWIGGKVFVNELYLQQSASLLCSPLVGFYHHLVPNNAGLVLFVRHLFWFLALYTAINVSRLVDESWLKLTLASLVICFVPASIPSLSYNTISYFMFINSIVCGIQLWRTSDWRESLKFGLFVAVTVIAYPSLVLALATLSTGLASLLFFKGRIREVKTGLLSFVTSISIVVLFFAWIGFDALFDSIEFSKHFAVGDLTHLLNFTSSILGVLFPNIILTGIILLSCAFVIWRFKPEYTHIMILVGSFIFGLTQYFREDAVSPNFLNHIHIVFISLFALLMLLIKSSWLQKIILVSLIVAMASLAVTSSNGLFASAYPAYIAIILAFALVRSFPIIAVPVTAVVIATTFFLGGRQLYREKSISNLDTWVTEGAFAGLLTNSNRANLLKQVEQDLKEQVSANSVLFYDSFPAGYLLSSKKPETRSLYMQIMPFGAGARPKFVEHFQSPAHLPDVVFDFNMIEIDDAGYYLVKPPDPKLIEDPMRDFFLKRSDYKVIHERADYRVLRRIL